MYQLSAVHADKPNICLPYVKPIYNNSDEDKDNLLVDKQDKNFLIQDIGSVSQEVITEPNLVLLLRMTQAPT